jgi:hypothetical protein
MFVNVNEIELTLSNDEKGTTGAFPKPQELKTYCIFCDSIGFHIGNKLENRKTFY